MLPHSEACERNKEPIRHLLETVFSDVVTVLEVGSGTGQHAEHFSKQLPHLNWQTSDQKHYLSGLMERVSHAKLGNLRQPLLLDVLAEEWPSQVFDAVYSANTLHIMSWRAVEAFFAGVGDVLKTGSLLVVYGPFKYEGFHTSDSNQHFDDMLRSQDALSGIRDFEAVNDLAQQAHLHLVADHEMPANNRCLVWEKQ